MTCNLYIPHSPFFKEKIIIGMENLCVLARVIPTPENSPYRLLGKTFKARFLSSQSIAYSNSGKIRGDYQCLQFPIEDITYMLCL